MSNLSENFTAWNSSTPPTTENQHYTTGYVSIALISASILFDLIFLSIVIATKSKFVRTEYFILISISILSPVCKLPGIYKQFNFMYNLRQMGVFNCLLNVSIDPIVGFTYFMIYLYYSLFHLSTLSRKRAFLYLFNIVHERPRNYLIFLGSVFASYTIYITIFTITTYSYLFDINPVYGCSFDSFNRILAIPLCPYLIPNLTPFFYLIGCLFSIKLMMHKKTKAELRKIRRNCILSIKFFLFSFTNLFIVTPQYIFPLLYYLFFYFDDMVYTVFSLIGQIMLLCQTLFLMVINYHLRHRFYLVFIMPIVSGFIIIREFLAKWIALTPLRQ